MAATLTAGLINLTQLESNLRTVARHGRDAERPKWFARVRHLSANPHELLLLEHAQLVALEDYLAEQTRYL